MDGWVGLPFLVSYDSFLQLVSYRITLLKLLMQSSPFDENLHRINMVRGSSDFNGTRNQILHHPFKTMPNCDTTSLR